MKKISLIMMLIVSLSLSGCNNFTKEGALPNVDSNTVEVTKTPVLSLTSEDIINKALEVKEEVNKGVSDVGVISKLNGTKIISDGKNKMDIKLAQTNEIRVKKDTQYSNFYLRTDIQQGIGYKDYTSTEFWWDKVNKVFFLKQDDAIWTRITEKELKEADLDLSEMDAVTIDTLYTFANIFKNTDDIEITANYFILKRKYVEADIKDLLSNADILDGYGADIESLGIGNIIQYKSKAKDGTIADMFLYINKNTYKIEKFVIDYSNLDISALVTIKEFTVSFINNTNEDTTSLSLPSFTKNEFQTLTELYDKLEKERKEEIEQKYPEPTDTE